MANGIMSLGRTPNTNMIPLFIYAALVPIGIRLFAAVGATQRKRNKTVRLKLLKIFMELIDFPDFVAIPLEY